jgi:hypothetical protein
MSGGFKETDILATSISLYSRIVLPSRQGNFPHGY